MALGSPDLVQCDARVIADPIEWWSIGCAAIRLPSASGVVRVRMARERASAGVGRRPAPCGVGVGRALCPDAARRMSGLEHLEPGLQASRMKWPGSSGRPAAPPTPCRLQPRNQRARGLVASSRARCRAVFGRL